MLKLKKIWLFLLGSFLVLGFNFQFAWRVTIGPMDRDHDSRTWSQDEDRPSDWVIDGHEMDESDTIWQWTFNMWEKNKWILHLPHADDYDTELWYALALVKIAVNWILWILAFIAFVYMLYSWFLVLSAWSDDKNVAKWKKWISNAAIAIAWIGLAWLIVSAMIRFIKNITQRN